MSYFANREGSLSRGCDAPGHRVDCFKDLEKFFSFLPAGLACRHGVRILQRGRGNASPRTCEGSVREQVRPLGASSGKDAMPP